MQEAHRNQLVNIAYSFQIRAHRKFAVEEGDHLTMLNVYEAFIKVSTAATQKVPTHTPIHSRSEDSRSSVSKGMAKRLLYFSIRLLSVLLIHVLGLLPEFMVQFCLQEHRIHFLLFFA